MEGKGREGIPSNSGMCACNRSSDSVIFMVISIRLRIEFTISNIRPGSVDSTFQSKHLIK